MKNLVALYSLVIAFCSLGQLNEPLNKWPGKMEDDKRSVVADEIIFKYKYSSLEIVDSVVDVLNQTKKLSAWNHLIYGEFEKANSDYGLALNHLDTCLETAKSTFLLIRAHTSKAKVLTIRSELSLALDHFLMALNLSRGEEFVILRAKTYAALGEFYRKASDFNIAFEYLDSAQLIVDENLIYDEVNIDILDRKSAIFSQIGPVDSMLYYSHKALSMANDQQNLHAQAVSHNELGYYFEHSTDWDSAYYHYDQAIQIWSETNTLRYLANVQINKSRLLIKDDQFENAKELLFDTKEFSEDKGWYELYPQLYEHICVVYQGMGDSLNLYKYETKKVQAYFDKYVIETEKTILEMESQIELNKLKDSLSLQNAELSSLQSQVIAKNSKIRTLTIVGFVAVLVALLLSILLLRSKRKNPQ